MKTSRTQIRGRGEAGESLAIGTILVPVDFSECSQHGLDYAKSLAERFGAKLILLHSVPLQYYLACDECARYNLPLLMTQAEKAAKEQLQDLAKKTGRNGIEVKGSLQIGHAGEQVCARAVELGADIIVTSTHGRTGFKHVLLGSTAEYIVRHATCPVVVVPSHKPATTR